MNLYTPWFMARSIRSNETGAGALGALHIQSIDGRIGAVVRTPGFLRLWSLWWLADFQRSVTHVFILRFGICWLNSRSCGDLMPSCIIFYCCTYLIQSCFTSSFRCLLINLRFLSCRHKNTASWHTQTHATNEKRRLI